MAALKMGCHAQAIEHCDKVLRLLEFLLEKPEDPLVVKALQRRATARTALGHHKEAVAVRPLALRTLESCSGITLGCRSASDWCRRLECSVDDARASQLAIGNH